MIFYYDYIMIIIDRIYYFTYLDDGAIPGKSNKVKLTSSLVSPRQAGNKECGGGPALASLSLTCSISTPCNINLHRTCTQSNVLQPF